MAYVAVLLPAVLVLPALSVGALNLLLGALLLLEGLFPGPREAQAQG